ncbi:hypothetical protein ACFOYW_16960 [Gryllotalpicola reticulitermitis]|uniref:Type VII secretion protein EccE n=1 Tax=Gryllotalpicola reticulitermitis TaxID=1184153 RepID=A0ABV8QC04_9MICO
MPENYERFIGGEGGHRAFFGSRRAGARTWMLVFFVLAGMVGTIFFHLWGVGFALVGVMVTLALTTRTHNGTWMERHEKRARWKARKRAGTDRFEPYDVAKWDQLHAERAQAKGRHALELDQQINAMRANPDGADGMGWLQYGSNQPGIAWHSPVGEDDYLSVAFNVSGQVRGIESSGHLTRAASAFGRFLAARGGATSLIRDVQPLTRVLPPDTARHQAWARTNLEQPDPGWDEDQRRIFHEQQASYDEVIRRTSSDAMVQRHYVVVNWPLTQQFFDAAEKFAPGRDGWRELMDQQIVQTIRGLQEARMGKVTVLTARQTAALILHQQNPSMPIDAVRRVDPTRFGIPSHDEFSAHVVTGYDPTVLGPDDQPTSAPAVEWWHRTAAIRAENMSVSGRSPLWALDLLIGKELDFIRSVAFHEHLVPAADAKSATQRDVVRDQSELISAKKAGRLGSDETEENLTGAQRRARDLRPGSHHHGVEWIGYVTITAPTRAELAQACRQLQDVCDTGLGINRLEWQDSYQAAASGTTWPIGRGLKPSAPEFSSRVMTRLAGRSEKEAIS